jgi:hypothetical protein
VKKEKLKGKRKKGLLEVGNVYSERGKLHNRR